MSWPEPAGNVPAVTDPRQKQRRDQLVMELVEKLKPGYSPTERETRGRVFPALVAAFFFLLGLGALAAAPILRWECERDATGSVNCLVKKRLGGVIPLGEVTLSNILAADVRTHESPGRRPSDAPYTAAFLVVACADGTRWSPFESADPLGRSHQEMAGGINDLVRVKVPATFRAWQGETAPLLVGTVFLVPMALLLALVLLRKVLFVAWSSPAVPPR